MILTCSLLFFKKWLITSLLKRHISQTSMYISNKNEVVQSFHCKLKYCEMHIYEVIMHLHHIILHWALYEETIQLLCSESLWIFWIYLQWTKSWLHVLALSILSDRRKREKSSNQRSRPKDYVSYYKQNAVGQEDNKSTSRNATL